MIGTDFKGDFRRFKIFEKNLNDFAQNQIIKLKDQDYHINNYENSVNQSFYSISSMHTNISKCNTQLRRFCSHPLVQ